MYSDKKNVLQLVALLRAHGVRRAVLCPGSRNVPLVQAFATCGGFECFSVTDERSAGFFAIGLALHVQAPVTDGRADFAAAGCFRWFGAEGGQPARGTYRGR